MSAIEVWRGGVKSDQLDEMGHLNVRFYVALAMEGLTGLAHALGMSGAFSSDAGATLIVREHHIRFLREARARAPLHMTAEVLSMEETDARVLFVLWHSLSGEAAATYNTVISHVDAKELRPFPWPAVARERSEGLMGDLPDFARARSTPLDPVEPRARMDAADELGLPVIARGAIGAADCDGFGRMQAEHFMGFIVSGIPQMSNGFREAVVEATDPKPARVGNAALEYRLLYLDWPRTGDLYVIRTGVLDFDQRGMNVVHWMLDPVSGRAWGSCQAYIVTFDLEARKIMPVPPAARTVLDERIARGVSL
jgi:acyl-CoA thioester hydrolase